VLEIAGGEPAVIPAAMPAALGERERRIDCMVGEKLRMRWMDP
jgi:hypothetical protein